MGKRTIVLQYPINGYLILTSKTHYHEARSR
jgi:hypothetical protein